MTRIEQHGLVLIERVPRALFLGQARHTLKMVTVVNNLAFMDGQVEILVIGGSFAGLAAAKALARSNRSVAVIDSGSPRNEPSPRASNVLGREGEAPVDIVATARQEALNYGVELLEGRAVQVQQRALSDYADGIGFVVQYEQNSREIAECVARRVILATGLSDEVPDLPGLSEGWGEDVLHCPYCHGYEYRGRRVAILATNSFIAHFAALFARLSEVTVVEHAGEIDEESRRLIEAAGARIVSGPAISVKRSAGVSVELAGGVEVEADAVAVMPYFRANADLYTAMGGELEELPNGVQVPTDEVGQTSIPGLWAAGNVADVQAMLEGAVAHGVKVAAMLNANMEMADLQARAEN